MNARFAIVALGEVLWDVFPDGARFGGAPANMACHAASLGTDASIVSRVGDDELGRKACEALREHGVNTDCVAVTAGRPTGTVQVELDAAGKPRFTICENVAWDWLEWSEEIERLATRCDAVCFGTLGQRSESSRQAIQRTVAAVPSTALRILDVNLRPPFVDDTIIRQSIELANVLKLSDEELNVVASACGVAGSEAETLAELGERYELRLIALTRGERGALLVRDREVCEQPGIACEIADTVGAGDAFTAATAVGLLAGWELGVIARRANEVAAFVCSQPGGTPPLAEHVKRTFGAD